jgi:ATP-dependent Clp protease ATP-binding subunit ClpX
VKILAEPKNALVKQYKYLFELDGIELAVEEGALVKIAEQTLERKTGARGLRSVMENILSEVMFNAPGDETVNKVTITTACAEGLEAPLVEHGQPRKRILPPKKKQKRKIG